MLSELVRQAVAKEYIDFLPHGALRPFVVADHSSASTAAYTKNEIEIQGLKLWLSGIGRPTGNARTERVIGTLKREEIYLQEQHENEETAYKWIGAKIYDYNFHRPNQGNGGFAHSLTEAPLSCDFEVENETSHRFIIHSNNSNKVFRFL